MSRSFPGGQSGNSSRLHAEMEHMKCTGMLGAYFWNRQFIQSLDKYLSSYVPAAGGTEGMIKQMPCTLTKLMLFNSAVPQSPHL